MHFFPIHILSYQILHTSPRRTQDLLRFIFPSPILSRSEQTRDIMCLTRDKQTLAHTRLSVFCTIVFVHFELSREFLLEGERDPCTP